MRETLKKFFSDDAVILSNVYETEDLHNEHDLVVLWNRVLFVIESKASPPVEPFRDPEKAFTRISRAFRSDRGIQNGFDQANRLRKLVACSETLELYDVNSRLNEAGLTRDLQALVAAIDGARTS